MTNCIKCQIIPYASEKILTTNVSIVSMLSFFFISLTSILFLNDINVSQHFYVKRHTINFCMCMFWNANYDIKYLPSGKNKSFWMDWFDKRRNDYYAWILEIGHLLNFVECTLPLDLEKAIVRLCSLMFHCFLL